MAQSAMFSPEYLANAGVDLVNARENWYYICA